MSVEPTTVPLRRTRLPSACDGNATRATSVMTAGYATPSSAVKAANSTTVGRRCSRISGQSQCDKQQVDELDTWKRNQHAAQAIEPEIATQQLSSTDRAI